MPVPAVQALCCQFVMPAMQKIVPEIGLPPVIDGVHGLPTFAVAEEGAFGGLKFALPTVMVAVFEADPELFVPVIVAE